MTTTPTGGRASASAAAGSPKRAPTMTAFRVAIADSLPLRRRAAAV
jgi:hypothetical protein